MPQEQPLPPGRKEHRIQEALARSLGVPAELRERIVREMLQRHRIDAVSYWLQIVLATAIATYGLVLSSTGVVIGAMLISPLMGPIVGFGFGIALFDLAAIRRSLVALAVGIAVAVSFTALVVSVSPLQTVTSEIAARTRPLRVVAAWGVLSVMGPATGP